MYRQFFATALQETTPQLEQKSTTYLNASIKTSGVISHGFADKQTTTKAVFVTTQIMLAVTLCFLPAKTNPF